MIEITEDRLKGARLIKIDEQQRISFFGITFNSSTKVIKDYGGGTLLIKEPGDHHYPHTSYSLVHMVEYNEKKEVLKSFHGEFGRGNKVIKQGIGIMEEKMQLFLSVSGKKEMSDTQLKNTIKNNLRKKRFGGPGKIILNKPTQ